MELSVDSIKSEPSYEDFEQIPVDQIKLEIKSETDVVEIDERIFLQGSSQTQKEVNETNICNTIEDAIIYDEIVKEEPVFYDPNETEALGETTNLNKKSNPTTNLELSAEKIYECYICKCETGSIGLLKWHLQERHPQFSTEHSSLKRHDLLPKSNWNQSKENSTKRGGFKEKTFKENSLKQTLLEKRDNVKEKISQMVDIEVKGSRKVPLKTNALRPTIQGKTKKSLECSHCHREFTTLERLESHERVHTNQKPFQCQVCLKFYNSQFSLQTHHLLHTGEKRFSCTKCEMKFRLKRELKHHMRLHEKRLECGQCGRKFGTLQHLKTHQRVHTDHQPFRCPVCYQLYNNQISFAFHMRIHTGKKHFSCNICDMKFRLKVQLDRHVKVHIDGTTLTKPKLRRENIAIEEIPNIRSYACYMCPFEGPRDQVRIHIKDEHIGEKLYQCNICSKKFLFEYSIESHLKTHAESTNLECHICGKILSRKKALKSHIERHTGLKQFECEHCKKRFFRNGDLVRHSRVHTGERPFKCDFCKMTFSRNHLLTDHKQSKHFFELTENLN